MFNDTGDPTVTATVYVVLAIVLAITIAHIVTGLLILKDYRATNKLCAATMWVNIGLLIGLAVAAVMIFTSAINLSENPNILQRIIMMVATLDFNLIPALSIASIVLSIIVIAKRKSITR